MKKKYCKNSLCLLVLIFGIVSCHNSEYKKIASQLESVDSKILNNDYNIVLIPGEGCGGCISNATKFVVENIDVLEIQVVFTKIGDLKLLKNTLPPNFVEHERVYFDIDNLLDFPKLTIYPLEMQIKNRLVVDLLELSIGE